MLRVISCAEKPSRVKRCALFYFGTTVSYPPHSISNTINNLMKNQFFFITRVLFVFFWATRWGISVSTLSETICAKRSFLKARCKEKCEELCRSRRLTSFSQLVVNKSLKENSFVDFFMAKNRELSKHGYRCSTQKSKLIKNLMSFFTALFYISVNMDLNF